eukprot:gb/GEZN01008657.1/.p1 GENE.gb/GEZN01008657.1/~~gb/GEZN01008657.1/.p1  ORF type:complete len:447 (-),score=75.43 gb/GEZN01008657.1/:62-1354(-)
MTEAQVQGDLARWDPFRKIYEAFICSICLEDFTDVHMTECGHNFCEVCIRESLDRRKICPLCQRPTTPDRLIRNHTMESLLRQVKDQKEQLIKKYVQDQLQASKQTSAQSVAPVLDKPNRPASAIEVVFQKHTRKALLDFEIYRQRLYSNFESRQLELKARYEAELGKLHARVHVETKSLAGASFADSDDFPAQLAALPELQRTESLQKAQQMTESLGDQFQKESEELKSWFLKAEASVVAAYEEYMTRVFPSPYLLPLQCSINASQSAGMLLRCDTALQPTDKVEVIFKVLQEKFPDVIGFGADMKIGLTRTVGGAVEAVQQGSLISDLQIQAGAEFVISGEIKLQSKQLPKCLTADWTLETAQPHDYYQCKTCNLNWVCKACSEVCHRGHDVRVFMRSHKPSYACCYCMQKRKCIIENSRTSQANPPS